MRKREERRRPWVTALAVLATVAVVGAGCSDSNGDARGTGSVSTASTTTAPGYEPEYTAVACDGERFADLTVPAGAECGTLTVPEDRADPTGRQVTLAVLSLPAVDGSVDNTPVVYLSGGPGDAAINEGWEERTVAADRPVVLVDQRGTGRSTPSLECPEVDESTWRELAEGMDLEAREASSDAAFAACRARLVDEADLDQYDTPAMAADMVDLHTAMGLEEWSILGVSYGTSVGQEILRSRPAGLQAAVLDSVVPPDVDDGPVAGTKRAHEAFDRLFEACGEDATCAAAHPDLEGDLLTIRDRLNAEPHEVPFTDADGVERVARLTGDTVLSGIFQAMYDSSLIGLLPGLIGQVADGRDGVLDAVGGPLLAALAQSSNGVFRTVTCADHQRLATAGDAAELRAEYPLAAYAAASDDGCDDWDVESVPEDVNTIGEVDVPTLLFGNEFDPVTPAGGTERVAEKMGPKATFVGFPALGHGALFAQDACPTSIADAFLAAPDAPVNYTCVAEMPALVFA